MSDHPCSGYNINGSPRLRGEASCVLPVKMRIRSFFAMVSVFLLVILAGLPAAFAVPQDPLFGKVIYSVTFNQSIDTKRIDPGIKRGDILTRERVKAAIQSLYNSGRFSSIAVETFPDQDGVRVQFNLRLNYYFNRFSISGNVDLGGRTLWETLNLPTGQPFTNRALEQVRQEVQDYIKGRGYYMVEVEARTVPGPEDRFVDTVFEVRPGDLATIRSLDVGGVPDQESGVIRDKLGFRTGKVYERWRLRRQLERLKDYFVKRGYLAAVPDVVETFHPENNSVDLLVTVANYGKLRVAAEGFKIDKDQLRRLLPVLTGEGLGSDILEEGAQNLRDFLEESGYPEADVEIRQEEDKAGVRMLKYVIIPGRKTTVAYVNFQRNQALSSAQLQAAIQIQASRFMQKSTYSVPKLDSDLQTLRTLYQSKGYLDARIIPLIKPLKDGRQLGITFECNEGPLALTRSVKLHGNATLAGDVLAKKMILHSGGPYSPFLAEGDRQNLISSYNDAGFLLAKVQYRATESEIPGSYEVEFEIEEGVRSFVDKILLFGNYRTEGSVISRQIALKENTPLSLGKMLQSQQALYRLGVFDLVRVAPQNSEGTAAYQDIAVHLEETKPLIVRYGLGYQEREKVRATLDLSHVNLWGTAHRADLQLRGSAVEQGAVLTIQQPVPVLQFQNVTSYFTVAGRRLREVGFDQTRANVAYQFSRPISGHSWALLRYNFTNVRLSHVNVSPDQIGREDTARNLSTFSTTYVNDTRDDYLDPSKGFFTSTDLGLTTKLLGSNDYFSLFSQSSYYHRLPAAVLFASSLRFGLLQPFGGDTSVPISERFFAGGGASLRGFETDFAGPLDPVTFKPVGGNVLGIANLEFRFPLLGPVQLATFYDTGNVFANPGDVRLSGLSHTVGFGIRIKTPFGPLRADYGYNLNLQNPIGIPPDQRLHRGHFFITIGPPF